MTDNNSETGNNMLPDFPQTERGIRLDPEIISIYEGIKSELEKIKETIILELRHQLDEKKDLKVEDSRRYENLSQAVEIAKQIPWNLSGTSPKDPTEKTVLTLSYSPVNGHWSCSLDREANINVIPGKTQKTETLMCQLFCFSGTEDEQKRAQTKVNNLQTTVDIHHDGDTYEIRDSDPDLVELVFRRYLAEIHDALKNIKKLDLNVNFEYYTFGISKIRLRFLSEEDNKLTDTTRNN